MKACEPKLNETAKYGRFVKKYKTYIDYLKESNYPEDYKNYCIDYYQSYIKQYNIFSIIND